MPNPMIKKDAKRGYGSKKALEKKWDEAGEAAEKSHPDNKYALQNFIYQRKKKAKSSVLDKVELNAARRLIASERK